MAAMPHEIQQKEPIMHRILLTALIATLPAFARAEFDIITDAKTLTISEHGKPVLVFQKDLVEAPKGVEPRFRRTAYIHPLYGINGEVLTEDFPGDHYHHRGVFWGWPNGEWRGKRVDTWGLDGSRQVMVDCRTGEVSDASANFHGTTHWILDDTPDTPIIEETFAVTVHAATEIGRALDFTITLKNISDALFYLRGATTENKGYGGFNIRPDSARKPMHFTTANGPQIADTFIAESPWVDVSYATAPGADTQSGAAIFQHPANPNYPHKGWLIRHYAFLGHAWPGNNTIELAPGKEVTVKYRLYIHQGTADEGKVAEAFAAYMQDMIPSPPLNSSNPN
jgi:hypothetical protein